MQAGLRRMEYVYDMGDYWEHRVIVERLTAPLSEGELSAISWRRKAMSARGLRWNPRLL